MRSAPRTAARPGDEHQHAAGLGRHRREGSEEQRGDRRIDELVEVRERGRVRGYVGRMSVDDRQGGRPEDAEVLERNASA